MANVEWLEIFASYTPDELTAHIATLKSQIGVFTSQNVGQKGYTKDLGELRGQLAAAVRVQNERGMASGGTRTVVTDFSGIT